MPTPNPLSDPNVAAALAQIKAKQPTTAATIQAGLNEWYTGPQGPLITSNILNFGLKMAASQGFASQVKVIKDYVARTKPLGTLDKPVDETVLPSVAGFLAALVNPHTWLRVAEVGIGLLLVAVGVAKLTGAVSAATKIANTVGKLPI